MDDPSAALPTLETLRAARIQQDRVQRWLRLVGPIVVLLLAFNATRAQPRPALHGPGLRVLLAVTAFAVGAVGAMTSLRGPRWLHLLLVGVLLAGSIGLLVLQPDGAGLLGLFIVIALTTQHLRRRGTRILVTGLVTLLLVTVIAVGTNRSPVSGVLAGIALSSFYALCLLEGRLREANEQAEHLLVELEQTRQAQAQAAALAERQRLTREMHDVLAHSLSGLVIQLDAARMLAPDGDPRLVSTIERARHLAGAGLDETRQAISLLRDEALPGPELLTTLIGEFQHNTGIATEFSVSGQDRPLSAQTGLAVYRVAQEALTNAAKHAHPDRVQVHLAVDADRARLVVEDSGRDGPPEQRDPAGHGLTGMRERAELLGGTLHAGATGAGFRVELVVPG